MKVALISHPEEISRKQDFPPIGTAYLGAVSNSLGYETLLIDAGKTSVSDTLRKLRDFMPDFIGVTCWTINRGTVWRLCAELKSNFPEVFLALGGPHATLFPEHIFRKTHASAVVIGEGEETFRDLLLTLNGKGDIKKVNGLAIRNDDGTVSLTSPRARISDLDSIPFPFYNGFIDFDFNDYLGFPGLARPTAAVISSRGCIFNCTYCSSVSFWGNCWRGRSSDNILSEIEWLIHTMGARSIYFFDDNFTVRKNRVIEICKGIKARNLRFNWACCSHVKLVDRDLLKMMHESGCVSVDFGVESGSEKILKNINKKQTRSDIEKAFEAAKDAGVNARAYLMVGNMGETEATIDETIDLIGKIQPRSSIGAQILWLLPGTSDYNSAVKNGFISDNYWLESESVPYNLQEYSFRRLSRLRERLMRGIARKKGGLLPLLGFYMKLFYYRFPSLAILRSLIPDFLR